MTDLKNIFQKESKQKKIILLSSAIAFVGTFFPWTSVPLKSIYVSMGSISANGWHGAGYLCVLASLAIIALWALPRTGIKIKLPASEQSIEKILILAMLAGPVVWIINMDFNFEYLGYGIYISLIAAAFATYTVFKKEGIKKMK